MKLQIDYHEGSGFEIWNPAWPGASPCGRGRTLMEAMGRFLHVAQTNLGIEFEVTEKAQPYIDNWYKRELAKR